MNTEEKAKQQKFIVQNLKGIESTVADLVKVKDAFREKVNTLTSQGTEVYSHEYLEKELERIKADIRAKMAAANTDMVKRLEELRGLIAERDSVLDLSNPALTNALSLIQTIGSGITFEESVKINANFVHDQSGLRALRAAYNARGITNSGGIDALIYDLNPTIDTLKELAYEGLVQDGSINFFSGKFAKLAELEGLTIEATADAAGAYEAMRRAAGLPQQ